ncbi:MAG: DUF1844 domain-containing protein [Planctomycetota bacterium]
MSDETTAPETESAEEREATLLQFLSGMGGQTLMHLGQMANPITGGTEVDLPNAKYSIDLLSVIEEKTKGNLTEEENEYLTNMLTQLRLAYVAAVEEAAGVKIKPGEEGEA